MGGESQGLFSNSKILKMDKKTRMIYIGSLILAIALLIVGIAIGRVDKFIITIPLIILLSAALFYDRNVLHIPPALVITIIIAMYLSLFSGLMINEMLATTTSIFTGFVLGTIGIIIAYLAIGRMPGTDKEKTGLISIEAFAVGIALYTLWILLAYILMMLTNYNIDTKVFQELMARSFFNAIGAALVSIIYFYGYGRGYFDKAIIGFLDKNSETMGLNVDDNELVEKVIKEGESNRVEFKSTLYTNLKTGEKDKRMEKAVLKTLVAFLNSDGGTLLVGVEDNGNIMGVDIEAFDSRDKMSLHITHLISAQIGDEYLPFIRFRLVDFGKKESGKDKIVVIFECRPTSSPAFFKEPKEGIEIYFVRSGPSTVELTGMDLLKYVNNRNKNNRSRFLKKIKYAAAKPQ